MQQAEYCIRDTFSISSDQYTYWCPFYFCNNYWIAVQNLSSSGKFLFPIKKGVISLMPLCMCKKTYVYIVIKNRLINKKEKKYILYTPSYATCLIFQTSCWLPCLALPTVTWSWGNVGATSQPSDPPSRSWWRTLTESSPFPPQTWVIDVPAYMPAYICYCHWNTLIYHIIHMKIFTRYILRDIIYW